MIKHFAFEKAVLNIEKSPAVISHKFIFLDGNNMLNFW
jgi:hypothetical protein